MKRTIHYYFALHKHSENPLKESDVKVIFGNLTVATANNKTAYLDIGNGEFCRAWIEATGANELGCLRWGKTRQNGLPQIEGQGTFRSIPLNSSIREGINDLSHVVFFKNGVVGIEFNFYGPRINKLAEYINTKTNLQIFFAPIINPNMAAKLANLSTITKFELKVKSDELAALDMKNKDFDAAVQSLGDFTGATDISFSMSIDPRRQEGLLERVKKLAAKLAFSSDAQSGIRKIKLQGRNSDDNRITEINLLEQYIISKQEMILTSKKNRVVSSSSAFSAIHKGFNENILDIRRALGLAE